MSGKKSKRKGYLGEHELVKLLKNAGINAKRVPLSGATKFQKGDILLNDVLTAEVKRRKNGFKEIYKWLEDKNLVFMRADRKNWLVVMDIDFFLQLMKHSC